MQHRVALGIPGPTVTNRVLQSVLRTFAGPSAERFTLSLMGAGDEGGGNFDTLWAEALNRAEANELDFFALQHADVFALHDDWISTGIDALNARNAAMVSFPVAIRDRRGLCSCGLGNLKTPWWVHRRVTLHELHRLPAVFGLDDLKRLWDANSRDLYLVHNSGLAIFDLRCSAWRNEPVPNFEYRRRVVRDPNTNRLTAVAESEDFAFSRQLAEAGTPTIMCRVPTDHQGIKTDKPWGEWEVDKDMGTLNQLVQKERR